LKTLKLTTLFVILAMLLSVVAYAESYAETCASTIEVTGESRYRIQMDGPGFYDYNSDTDPTWYSQMRTRIGVKAMVADNMGVFAQFQDSRYIGSVDPLLFVDPLLDLHQGYMWYKPCEKIWFKLGRFEMNMHNERLIGAVDWSMYGQAFDGLMFGRELGENMKATAWATKDYESFDLYNDVEGEPAGDDMFYGLNFSFLNKGVDLFAMMNKDFAIGGPDESLLTFGAYSQRTFSENFDYDAMVALQSGTRDFGATEADLSGMLMYAEVGYTMTNGFRLAGLVDYTTGDDPTTGDKVESFNNLYFTPHKFYGAMDLFGYGFNAGIMDIALRGMYPINESWTFNGDFHSFATVEDYAVDKTALGTEIDLSGKYVDGGFAWQTGFSMFSLSDDYMADADSQNWLYTQATMSF
jgi:hypothetical protein